MNTDTLRMGPAAIRPVLVLVKFRLSLLIGLSAMAGAATCGPIGIQVGLAVLLLSCGAAALNQIQEIETDALLPRTAFRPLVTGALDEAFALRIALYLMASGLFWLSTMGSATFVAGLSGIVFYNGLYTPMKRMTHLAILPGIFCGMLPPVIGGLSAAPLSGILPSVFLAMTVAIWQVPHTWSILLQHRTAYSVHPFPNFLIRFPASRIHAISGIWTAAFSASMLVIPLVGGLRTPLCIRLVGILSLVTLVGGLLATARDTELRFGLHARLLRLSLAALLVLILLDSLLAMA